MRHTRFVSPRGVVSACIGLACILLQSGCTHNYYYGVNPCAPGSTVVVPGTVQPGPVCEVPASSTVVGSTAADGSTVRPPRVVLSEPGRGLGSRLSTWRASDPEGSAITTQVEGNVNASSPTVTR